MEARLIESREIAPAVRHFEFEALGVDRLEFAPGQFTSFIDMIDGKEITRALQIGRLAVELAVGVEQWRDRVQIVHGGLTDGCLHDRVVPRGRAAAGTAASLPSSHCSPARCC